MLYQSAHRRSDCCVDDTIAKQYTALAVTLARVEDSQPAQLYGDNCSFVFIGYKPIMKDVPS